MKKIVYVGRAKNDLISFSEKVRQRIMTALTAISAGLDLKPKDFKYMAVVGSGCYELRLKIDRQYRVFYVAKFSEAIYVLHAFVKKTEKTGRVDIEVGSARYKALINYRREMGYDKKD